MPVLLSIHDAAPPFAGALRELWAICLAHGARPALVVEPVWRGRWPLSISPRFIDWLYARHDQGARLVLRLDAAWSADRRNERLSGAVSALRAVGLSPIGVAARQGAIGGTLRGAARAEGLAFAEDARRLWRLADDCPRQAPLVSCEQPRGRWSPSRATIGLRAEPVTRLALHPSDVLHPAGRSRVGDRLEALLLEGALVTHRELLKSDDWRHQSARASERPAA